MAQFIGTWRLSQAGISHAQYFFDMANAFASTDRAEMDLTAAALVNPDDVRFLQKGTTRDSSPSERQTAQPPADRRIHGRPGYRSHVLPHL